MSVSALHARLCVMAIFACADRVCVLRSVGDRRSTGATDGRSRHGPSTQIARIGRDRLNMQLVVAKIIFCVVQHLTRLFGAYERRVCISGNNWCVVDKVDKSASMLRENSLLLSTLNCSCKVLVIRLLEFLTSLRTVSELHQRIIY